jgi:hypothetical protein
LLSKKISRRPEKESLRRSFTQKEGAGKLSKKKRRPN